MITPTRLKQATADVPAAVTLITAEMIRRLGLTRLVDILRLVPGMEVVEAGSADVRVSYHGTNISNPRRMNVLVDGISMYQPALATVDWNLLPIAVTDIDRIEVTRGSDSATYGPDSMLAIINIVSKHPKDAAPLSLSVSGGTPGTLIASVRGAHDFGSTTARASLEEEEQHGFDSNSLDPANFHSRADDYANTRFSLRTSSALGEHQTLEGFGYAVSSTQTQLYNNPGQITDPNIHSQSFDIGLKWKVDISDHNSLQTSASYSRFTSSTGWRSCLPALVLLPQLKALYAVDPAYASDILAGLVPAGGTAQANALALQTIAAITALGDAATVNTCADASINVGQGRADGEVQDTYVFGRQLRAVLGAGAREDYASSATLLDNGTRFDTQSYRFFGTVEYVPVTPVRINVGAYYEHASLDEDSFSPRVAVNWTPGFGSTFRAIVADGTRAPDMFEQAAREQYVVRNVSPAFEGSTTASFFETANGPGHLQNEKIINREVGYLLELPRAGLQLDIKVFDDSLYHLISEKLELSSFLPTNDGRVSLRGAELQASGNPDADWQWRATYAYLDNYDASSYLEQTEYSRHSGSLALSHTLAEGWRWSIADYGQTGNGVGQRGYERLDGTVGKAWVFDGKSLSVDITSSYYFTMTSSNYRDVDSFASSSYNDRFRALATVKVQL